MSGEPGPSGETLDDGTSTKRIRRETELNSTNKELTPVTADFEPEPSTEHNMAECENLINSTIERMDGSNRSTDNERDDNSPASHQSDKQLDIYNRSTDDDICNEPSTSYPAESKLDIDKRSTDVEDNVNEPSTSRPRESRKERFGKRKYRTQSDTLLDIGNDDKSSTDDEHRQNDIEQPQIIDESNDVAANNNDDIHSNSTAEFNAPNSEHSDTESNVFESDTSDDMSIYETDSDGDMKYEDYVAADTITKKIMDKPKSKYSFRVLPAILDRLHGFSGTGYKPLGNRNIPSIFENNVTGSLHVVERFELMSKLYEHDGCVNCLNFNRAGNLLLTGSDDLQLILWNWANEEVKCKIESNHRANVFQAKFIEIGTQGVNIVSSARDGQVRYLSLPPGGGEPASSLLIRHLGAVHKIATTPVFPYEVLSAGEDGKVVRIDLRENDIRKLITVRSGTNRKIRLHSVASHPLDREFCVCGQDSAVYVYDRRNCKQPRHRYIPTQLKISKRDACYASVTCAVYNYLGNEILASYCDEDIYLLDNSPNVSDGKTYVIRSYSGHRNTNTIKGVNFFGPQSEFVMSGSDCGNCFFWDKKTGAVVQWMAADENGTVNCLEPHPSFPVLATSGLDHDIKIWVPSHEEPSKMTGLANCIRNNVQQRRNNDSVTFMDHDVTNWFRQYCRRRRFFSQNGPSPADGPSASLDTSESDDDAADMRSISPPCVPS